MQRRRHQLFYGTIPRKINVMWNKETTASNDLNISDAAYLNFVVLF